MASQPDRLARGVLWGAFARASQLGLGLAVQAVTTRLIAPAEFGRFAYLLVPLGFVSLLVEAGLTAVVVRRQVTSERALWSLFLFAFMLGSLGTLATVFGAHALGRELAVGDVESLLKVAGLGLLPVGMNAVLAGVQLQRGRFGTIASIETATGVLSSAVVVVAAWSTHDAHALAIQFAATGWLRLCFLALATRLRPSGLSLTDVSSAVRDATYPTLFGSINFWARNADKSILGSAHGATELGAYAQAYKLLLMPVQFLVGSTEGVILHTLSKSERPLALRRQDYFRTLRAIAAVAVTAGATLVLGAEAIVATLWGDRWMAAAPLLRVFGLLVVIQPLVSTAGQVLIALDRTRTLFVVGTVNTAIMVASFVVGVRWGAVGVSLAYAAVYLFAVAPITVASIRNALGGDAREWIEGIGAPYAKLLLAHALVVGALRVPGVVELAPPWLGTCLAAAVAIATTVACLRLWIPELYRSLRFGRGEHDGSDTGAAP